MKRILTAAVLIGLMIAPEVSARKSTAPYPPSTAITGISWDFANIVRKAIGSDLWPVTWASDDNVYGGWGDGGGFDGNSNSAGRCSIGFARISGTAPAITGKNVWGAAPTYAENLATFAGKPESMISVGGTLYCWVSSNYNDNSGNPVLGGPNPVPTERRLAWSSDLSKTWIRAAWKLPETTGRFEPGSFINFGKDNAGARDQYVYQYGWIVGNSGSFLCRVLPANLKSDPGLVGSYQYYAGKDASGNPVWSTSVSAAQSIFFDPNGRGIDHSVYNAPLKRYIITSQGAGVQKLAVYDAPEPWGPWTTVAYYDTWGNYGTGESLGVDFANKWTSADGKTMWAVFSSVNTSSLPGDSFNLLKMTLTTPGTGGTGPKITNPPAGTTFQPGQTVSATGTGTSLTWSADRIGDGLPAIAQGAGSTFTFTVPADSTIAQHIHVTLTGSGGSDARDYPIGTASSFAAYWKFDEGSGSTTADASGHGNSGTLLNGPTWVTGKFGKALNFPAGKSVVNVGAKTSLANLHRTGMTVSAWINPRSGGAIGRIVDKDDNSIGWFFKMSSSTTLQFVSDNGGPSRTSTGTIASNAWQHVAVTWTGGTPASTAHVYVNGTLADGAGVDGAGSPGDDSGTPFCIGNRATALDRGFDGAIDDLRLYTRVLSASEIKALATATAP